MTDDLVFPPLGIMYLSSTLKLIDLTVQCIDLALGQPLSMIESNIVGISFTTSQKEEAFRIADLLRSEKILIAGGAHPTYMSQECLEHFDYVIQGEADYQLPALLSRIQLGGELNRVFSNHEPCDINMIPYPDRKALPIRSYHYLLNGEEATTMITSRSCPYSCSYCGKISSKYRVQSAIRTVDEIWHINKTYGYKAFMIFDDTFAVGKRRLKEIAWLLRNNKFIFRCFGRSDLLTPEVCSILKELNVVEVGVGIESGSNEVLKINMKGTSREQNFQAVKNLRKEGIRAKAFLIVGLPGETKETIDETRSWIEIAKPDDIDVSVFQPMPGSDVYKNPEKYDIQIDRNLVGTWYKGTPGRYLSSSSTKTLTAEQIVSYRDEIESHYKNKGGSYGRACYGRVS